jgi:large subunit ribosomal protein L44e
MVNIPKVRNTHCRRCGKHRLHKTEQYKMGKRNPLRQGERRYAKKQRGFGGQSRPILRRKAKVTKKLVLKLECTECKQMRMLPMKRAKYVTIGGGKKTKGEALVY